MGVEIVLCDGFEVVPPPELKELCLFDTDQSASNGDESTVTTEEGDTIFSGDTPPSNAAEECPSPQPFRSFYFVKQNPCNDSEIKTKIDEADKEIFQCNVARIQISHTLKGKRAMMSAWSLELESLRSEREGYTTAVDEKTKALQPFQELLQMLRNSSTGQLCCPAMELDDVILGMPYKSEQEKINSFFKFVDSLGGKEVTIQRIKTLVMDLNEVKNNQQAVTTKINRLSHRMKRTKMEMESLEVALGSVHDQRDKAFGRIKIMRRQRDLRNAAFFRNRAVTTKARELAAAGNVKELEDLANCEVEKFMSLWNADKAFRDDYVGNNSASHEERKITKDGRIKNLDDEIIDMRAGSIRRSRDKRGREYPSSCSSPISSVATEKTEEKVVVTNTNKVSSEGSGDLEFPRHEKMGKVEEVDEEAVKEKQREEQLEKARQAMERKKKLQEKAAAKAAIRAQKEAEKKLKEREKKVAKKKASVCSAEVGSEKVPEAVSDESEPEKAEALAVGKDKRSGIPKQRCFRFRKCRRGTEALPKAIIKRRKAYKFWVWTASSVAAACVLALVFALFFR